MLSFAKQLFQSIALVPIVLALCFLILAILLINIDIDYENYKFFRLLVIKDKADAQFIISFIIGGIFTLTIFSYTMVMNVLNRNINNYSPRLIPLLLSEKHHQLILGFTCGTIIYAMILSLSTISTSAINYPKIGASLGIIFSIISVFLFIYFIHSVSQSIHINYILKQVFERTEKDLEKQDKTHKEFVKMTSSSPLSGKYHSEMLGYLRQPNYDKLIKISKKLNIKIALHKLPIEFVYRGDLLFSFSGDLSEKEIDSILGCFAINKDVPLDAPVTGFKHLVEVAVKASSPALNDPGTSVSAIDYLTQLFIIRKSYNYLNEDKVGTEGVFSRENISNQRLFENCYLEMENYMQNDPLLLKHIRVSKDKIGQF